MHADRTNRMALILFGLLLFVAGGAALAASVGAFGSSYAHNTLLPAAAGVCVLIALVVLRWVMALLITTDRAGDITVSPGGEPGTTVIRPTALISAVASEISSYHGVDTAKGRVIGDSREPELVLTVTTAASADLAALRHRIEIEAIAHARQALGQPSLPVQLDLA